MKFLVKRIRELPHKRLIFGITVVLVILSIPMIPVEVGYERSVEYEVTYGYLRTVDDGNVVGCVVIKNVDEYGGTFTVEYQVLEIFHSPSSPPSLNTGKISRYVGPGEEKALKFSFHLSRDIHIDTSFGTGPPALIVETGPEQGVIEYEVHISSEVEPPTVTVTKVVYKSLIELLIHQLAAVCRLIVSYVSSFTP